MDEHLERYWPLFIGGGVGRINRRQDRRLHQPGDGKDDRQGRVAVSKDVELAVNAAQHAFDDVWLDSPRSNGPACS